LEVRPAGQRGSDFVGTVTNNQHFGGHRELIDRPQDMFDQRQARQVMQHLGKGRLHPGAFAGGQDNNVEIVGSVVAHTLTLTDYRAHASAGFGPSSGASWCAWESA